MLTALVLALPVFQGPEVPEKAKAAPPPLLMRVVHPTLTGLEKWPEPLSRGWLECQPVLDGKWLLVKYHQVWDDESVETYVMSQIMRQLDDNQVEAWHFDGMGGFSKWTGKISERGMVLETHADDAVVGRQVFEWDQGGYHFRLLGRGEEDGKLMEWFNAHYQPTATWVEAKTNPKFQKEADKIPYSWYLGKFSGKEISIYGPTTGSMNTTLGPGPWFSTFYESKVQGMTVFSGMGFVSAKKDGSYDLHWFESSGEQDLFSGNIGPDGTATIERKNKVGKVIERHTDLRKDENSYTFTIEQLNLKSNKWGPFMTGEYVRKTD
ncbi:MAG: hypothetical protein QGH51_08935 [Planctomycetota bacterium]|jgi:hypothetical protein|nr:hypothetical protein [Planctomycetota bacterium]MDP6942134.1 hypothetical protein [Planctomycetota bacterium]